MSRWNFAAGKLPVMTNAKDEGWYCNAPQYMCVSGASEHQEEAMMFLNYFYNNADAAKILKTVRSVPPTSVGQEACTELGILEASPRIAWILSRPIQEPMIWG